MRYEDLTTEQTKVLLDAIRNLIRNPPDRWQELDDTGLLALLDGGAEPTPQGSFQFSVPVSGWGAESYSVHWGDESVEIAQSRGNRASLADIERALESMDGIRDVEVTAPGPAEIIEGTGGRPYRVSILDADPDTLRVTKGNGKTASVRVVDDDEPAPVDPGGVDPGPGGTGAEQMPLVFEFQVGFEYYLTFIAHPTSPQAPGDDYRSGNIEVGYRLKDGVRIGPDQQGDLTNLEVHELHGNAESLIEAALESLPNVANAAVSIIDTGEPHGFGNLNRLFGEWKWRIELTEGPGGIVSLEVRGGDLQQNGELDNWGVGANLRPLSLGAAQFQFDAVTAGALTPSATAPLGAADLDGADEAGAENSEIVPTESAWPWAVHLADPAGHDLLI